MPTCTRCRVTVGMWENGFICPACMRLYSFDEGRFLDDFNEDIVCEAIDLFEFLGNCGLLAKGANKVQFLEDGLVITRPGDIF